MIRSSLAGSMLKAILVAGVFMALVACGGGKEGVSITPLPRYHNPSRPDALPAEYQFVEAPQGVTVGQTVSLSVLNDLKTISEVAWVQTEGPELAIQQPSRKLIAFVPRQPGSYQFESHMIFSDGSAAVHTFNIEAQSGSAEVIDIRVDRAVLMGQTVSLRAYVPDSLAGQTIYWSNLNTPNVGFVQDAQDPALIHVTAPDIAEDSVLVFQARVKPDTAQEKGDSVVLLVEPAPVMSQDYRRLFSDRLSRTQAYLPESPYSDDLAYCVYSNERFTDTTCSFLKLPLLGQNGLAPSVPEVLERVLVSHQWMGQRFAEFLALQEMNPDFMPLFRSVTAIVIADDLKSSFFDAATGALYLRPRILALTKEERSQIFEPLSTGSPWSSLSFFTRWRYVMGEEPVLGGGDIPYRSTKSFELADLQYEIARTLYHELAHAADFFPPAVLKGIPAWQRPWGYASERVLANKLASAQLGSERPIAKEPGYTLLNTLAQAIFRDNSKLDTSLLSLSATEYAAEFDQAEGVDLYAFVDAQEDFALLYESAMMQLRYGAIREVAVFDRSAPETVIWGEAGRIGRDTIKARARQAMSAIRPGVDAEIILNQLSEARGLTAGEVWSKVSAELTSTD